MINCDDYQPRPAAVMPVPYWTESMKAADCNTCGRDVWVGERCVISGPTTHCRLCGAAVCCYEDDGEVRTFPELGVAR